MVTLYHHPFSQHSRRVVALLEHANVPYEGVRVALEEGKHREPTYLAINPNHQVPTLIDGDLKLHESNAIMRYLATKHGLVDLYPTDAAARARVDQWLDWNQARLAPTVFDLVFNKKFAGEAADATAIERGAERLKELAAILEEALGKSAYLAGASLTLADFSVSSNVFQLGLSGDAPSSPKIAAWFARVSALPAFAKSLPKT